MRLDDIQLLAGESGLCLPLIRSGWKGYAGATIGGLVALGLPHWHQFSLGSIRDWVIGMTFVTGQGEVVKSGANVVKSVAGFSLHKVMVGSAGSLGVITEVALRLAPVRIMPEDAEEFPDPCWIHRIPRGADTLGGQVDPSGQWVWSNRRLDFPKRGEVFGPGGVINRGNDRFRVELKRQLDPTNCLVGHL
jgi:glycolate oxidase FAD binding subunit